MEMSKEMIFYFTPEPADRIYLDTIISIHKAGAISGYNISQQKIELLERENKITESQLIIANEEIERLKGLITDAYDLGYNTTYYTHDPELQEQFDIPQSFEQFKKDNKI